MGVYTRTITVPAGTPPTSPTRLDVIVDGTILDRIGVLFPPGCSCLVGLQVYCGAKIVMPEEEGTWLVGDGESIWVPVDWELPERPARLQLRAFNNDTLHDHTIYVRIVTRRR